MEKARSILLILLLISFSCAVQAATLNITVVDDADDTPLKEASISVNGDYVGKTVTDGTYRFSHALNDSFYLKVSRTDYEDWLNLVSPTETAIRVEMTRKSEVVTVYAYDRETLLPLINAFVKITGENLSLTAQTDEQGKVQFSLKTGGTYTIEIRSTKYEPVLKTVDLSTSERTLQYWLYRSDLYIISVTDNTTHQPLQNATITINTNVAGTTGVDGRLVLNLERERKYRISIRQPDYEEAVVEKFLTGEDLLLEIPLIKSAYPVSIAVLDEGRRPIEDATVIIDGTQKTATDQYGRIGISTLPSGPHTIEVTADGYEPWSDRQNITGKGEEVVIELIAVSTNVTVRIQEADGQPVKGAILLVDNSRYGATDIHGEIMLTLKTGKAYNISVSGDGYRTASLIKDVPLGASSLPLTTITLERELDTGLIMITLIGIVVIIGMLLAVRSFWMERRTRRPRKH